MKVGWKKQASWFLILVYSSPNIQLRKLLWDSLIELTENVKGPWSVIGDFNPIL